MPTLEKPWTPEQEALAREWIELNREAGDKFCAPADRLYRKLEAALGETVWEALSDYVDETPGEENDEADTFTQPAEESGNKQAGAEGMPELLPFSKLPGYLFDAWGVPHRAKTRGRKAGKVPLENYLFGRKGRKGVQHMARYRLTVNGKQQAFYPRYLMRARIHAEQEWKRQSEVSPVNI